MANGERLKKKKRFQLDLKKKKEVCLLLFSTIIKLGSYK